MTEPARIGRPPGPDPVPWEIAERVLDGLHAGQPLTAICSEEGMPSTRAISRWTAKDPEFRAAFEIAREAGGAMMADEAQDIADAATTEDWQVAKLRADVRFRRAACYCPKVFGTNAHKIEHSGTVNLAAAMDAAQARLDAVPPALTVAPVLTEPASDEDDAG